MNEPSSPPTSASSTASPNRMLLAWARELQALAQAGLMYSQNPFDRERYERIRAIAVDMFAMQIDMPAERIRGLISGGYPTPKLDTRAVIFDADGRILLTHENNGEWSLPGGWVDENQSVRSNTIKEVKEEAGLDVIADVSLRCGIAPTTTACPSRTE